MTDNKNDGKILREDEDPEFEAALRRLPIVDVLPADWDYPEDDIYDEIYKDIGNDDDDDE